jgi:glycosyltransferase involved in cell wall biosynthesis
MSKPLISVVLPVYFGERYLRESVESILTQTFTNFEFIIFDDGSKDDSRKILESYSDSRIRLIFQENAGLPETLNRAIALSQGRYIARQDHDDISLPSRLQKQFEFLEANSDFAMVGTGADIWSEEKISQRRHDHPSDYSTLRFELLFNNPFVHSSLMFRSQVFQEVGLYSTDPARQPPEDYEFISRIARRYSIANLKERLVIYRETSNSMSSVIRPDALEKNNLFKDKLALISAENIEFDNTGALSPSRVSLEFGNIVHSCQSLKKTSAVPFSALINSLVDAFFHIFGDKPNNESWKLFDNRIRQTYIQYCLYKDAKLFDITSENIVKIRRAILRVIYKVRIRIMPILYIAFARSLFGKRAQNVDPKL